MPLVIITIIITFAILIIWTYHSLGNIETSKKIIYIIIQLLVIFIATYITYAISKGQVVYQDKEISQQIQNALLPVFTGINGLFIMPYLSRGIEALYQENIKINQLFTRAILCIVILIVLLIFECGYMTTTQQGILKIMAGER